MPRWRKERQSMSANSTDEYQRRFNAITEGQVVYSQKRKHKYVFSKKYCWKQAWSDCKTLAHRQLPPYWFVNEIGEVISVAYSTRPVFIVPDNYTDSDYPRYHVAMANGKTKSVSVYNLCALVWDVPVSEDVEDLLNAKGLYAFGTRNDDINGHHIDGDILNNHYSNIQLLVKRRHAFMHNKKYEQLSESTAGPMVIETPYTYHSSSGYIEHSGHNKLLEFSSPKEFHDYLKNTQVYITEALLEVDGNQYIIRRTDNY